MVRARPPSSGPSTHRKALRISPGSARGPSFPFTVPRPTSQSPPTTSLSVPNTADLDGPDQYAFLLARNMDRATLERAVDLARNAGAWVHTVLIALGWVSEKDYVAALALHLGVRVVGSAVLIPPSEPPGDGSVPATIPIRHSPEEIGLRATAFTPSRLADHLARNPAARSRTMLVTTADVEIAMLTRWHPLVLQRAARTLDVSAPELSARSGSTTWQRLAAALLIGLPIGGLAVAPEITLDVLMLVLALPFLCAERPTRGDISNS